jgi:uncharacterized protein
MTYAGTAQFTERDWDAGVVTLKATGKETRGAGTAGNDSAPAATPEPAVAEASTAPATASVGPPGPSEDSLDLFSVAGLPVLKRIAAPAGALLALLAAAVIWRRRRRR